MDEMPEALTCLPLHQDRDEVADRGAVQSAQLLLDDSRDPVERLFGKSGGQTFDDPLDGATLIFGVHDRSVCRRIPVRQVNSR